MQTERLGRRRRRSDPPNKGSKSDQPEWHGNRGKGNDHAVNFLRLVLLCEILLTGMANVLSDITVCVRATVSTIATIGEANYRE